MRLALVTFVLMFVTAGFSLSGNASADSMSTEKRYSDDVKVAVSLALDKMNEVGVGVSARSMVVARHRDLIVVSFVAMGNVRGGAMHVVYDPARKKIVHVKGEQ
jgi:hypothetical protein